jgi:hypothetical protein
MFMSIKKSEELFLNPKDLKSKSRKSFKKYLSLKMLLSKKEWKKWFPSMLTCLNINTLIKKLSEKLKSEFRKMFMSKEKFKFLMMLLWKFLKSKGSKKQLKIQFM